MSDVLARARSLRPGVASSTFLGLLPALLVVGLALGAQLWLAPALAASGNDFYAKILVDIAISVVLAVSLTMVNGFTGQFSIGHAAFMAVGAYAAACIVYYGSYRLHTDAEMHGGLLSSMITGRDAPFATGADLLFLASLLAGGLVAAACGYVVGLPSLRLKGDYLAIVTLGFGEIVRVLVQSQTTDVLNPYTYVTEGHLAAISSWSDLAVDDSIDAEHIAKVPVYLWPKYAGGALGFGGLPFYTSLFWVILFAGITLVVAFRVKNSTFGRAFLSIREDEIASESMGVNVTRNKVRAFVIAAFFAGIAGGLFAHTVGVQLNPAELGFQKSFDIIIMVVLGGLGSISGATLAAGIVTILPELLRKPETLAGLWPWGLALLALGITVAVALRKTGREPGLGKVLASGGVTLLVFSLLSKWAVSADVDLGRYRMVFFALALIIMMILRPQGLLGVREIWEGSLWKDMVRKKAQRRKAPLKEPST